MLATHSFPPIVQAFAGMHRQVENRTMPLTRLPLLPCLQTFRAAHRR